MMPDAFDRTAGPHSLATAGQRGRSALRRRWRHTILVALLLLGASAARGQVPARTEILPIDSVTLSEREFLTGITTGPAAKIAGELRSPRTNTRAPAVILMHGSSGIRANAFRWADEFVGLGVAVFIVDSFGGRGIADTGTDRIAVMGFSKGGFAALYASLRRFQRRHGPGPLLFAAHIAVYPVRL